MSGCRLGGFVTRRRVGLYLIGAIVWAGLDKGPYRIKTAAASAHNLNAKLCDIRSVRLERVSVMRGAPDEYTLGAVERGLQLVLVDELVRNLRGRVGAEKSWGLLRDRVPEIIGQLAVDSRPTCSYYETFRRFAAAVLPNRPDNGTANQSQDHDFFHVYESFGGSLREVDLLPRQLPLLVHYHGLAPVNANLAESDNYQRGSEQCSQRSLMLIGKADCAVSCRDTVSENLVSGALFLIGLAGIGLYLLVDTFTERWGKADDKGARRDASRRRCREQA